MSDIAIRVENLSKQYRIGGPQGRSRYKTIRESLVEAMQAPFHRLASVVRGQPSTVSNETLWALKDVSFEVQRGEVVGIINGTILGMKRAETCPELRRIERKFDEIVDFSGVMMSGVRLPPQVEGAP